MQKIKVEKIKLYKVEKLDGFVEVAFDIDFDFDNMNIRPSAKEGLRQYVFVVKIYPSGEKKFEVWHDRVYPKYNWVTSCCNKRGGGKCPYFEALGEEIYQEVLKDKETNKFFEKNKLRLLLGSVKE